MKWLFVLAVMVVGCGSAETALGTGGGRATTSVHGTGGGDGGCNGGAGRHDGGAGGGVSKLTTGSGAATEDAGGGDEGCHEQCGHLAMPGSVQCAYTVPVCDLLLPGSTLGLYVRGSGRAVCGYPPFGLKTAEFSCGGVDYDVFCVQEQ